MSLVFKCFKSIITHDQMHNLPNPITQVNTVLVSLWSKFPWIITLHIRDGMVLFLRAPVITPWFNNAKASSHLIDSGGRYTALKESQIVVANDQVQLPWPCFPSIMEVRYCTRCLSQMHKVQIKHCQSLNYTSQHEIHKSVSSLDCGRAICIVVSYSTIALQNRLGNQHLPARFIHSTWSSWFSEVKSAEQSSWDMDISWRGRTIPRLLFVTHSGTRNWFSNQ